MARDRHHICQAQSTIGTSTVCIRMCTNTMQRDPSTASWSPVGLLGPGESSSTKEAIDRGSPLHVFSFDDPHYQTWRKIHGRWNCRSSQPACVCLASSRHLAVMRTFSCRCPDSLVVFGAANSDISFCLTEDFIRHLSSQVADKFWCWRTPHILYMLVMGQSQTVLGWYTKS